MTHVRLTNINVTLPIYDSQSLRLVRLPSFRNTRVGTNTVSQVGSVLSMHVLRDISLDLAEGDRVCVIGHNGAGKTTLLRLLAGIYPPTSGTLDIRGKVFALLAGSLALNIDATGYENIHLAANLYEWPKSRIADYVRDIEKFTDLGDYLSLPMRVYSTGMQARLAFALATTQSSEILLIDEGIGAGDAQFQQKAQERVGQFMNQAKIIVLASHSMALCRALCNKALVLTSGRRVFYGGLEEGFSVYAQSAAAQAESPPATA
jgi:ABC-2 type transport system ATP-binding protein/lipopolysaccharide transport system ATP-binding protein